MTTSWVSRHRWIRPDCSTRGVGPSSALAATNLMAWHTTSISRTTTPRGGMDRSAHSKVSLAARSLSLSHASSTHIHLLRIQTQCMPHFTTSRIFRNGIVSTLRSVQGTAGTAGSVQGTAGSDQGTAGTVQGSAGSKQGTAGNVLGTAESITALAKIISPPPMCLSLAWPLQCAHRMLPPSTTHLSLPSHGHIPVTFFSLSLSHASFGLSLS